MMADTALDVQTDSGKAERACAWCGADISHRDSRALTCGSTCKQKRDKALNPGYTKAPASSRECRICGSHFLHINPRAKYCSDGCKAVRRKIGSKMAAKKRKAERKSNPLEKLCDWCGCAFSLERARGVVYRQTCSEECAQEKKNARWREMLANMPMDKRDSRRDTHRQWERNRSAAAAISLLIMPIEPSELNQ